VASASLLAEGVTVELDLAGTVDVAAERKRLEKDLAAARKEAQSMTAKLGNEGFTAKAPADVIGKSRARLAAAEEDITRLESRLAALG
jgi:valyl-tRNA synthetase